MHSKRIRGANTIKNFWQALRADADALSELRQLVFGIIVALGITYLFSALYINAKKDTSEQHLRQITKLQNSISSVKSDLSGINPINERRILLKELKTHIARLELQQKLMLEHYLAIGDKEAFTKAIFALLPDSPVKLNRGFTQMSGLEPTAAEFFNTHPVTLAGEMGFSDFFCYLSYLEQRPEVAIIGDLTLKIPQAMPANIDNVLHYDLELGRIEILPHALRKKSDTISTDT